jgi:hypothetical protein
MSARHPPFADIALAIGLVGLAAAEVLGTAPSGSAFLFAAALPLPLAWRRVLPIGAAVAVLAIVGIDALSGGDGLEFVFTTVVIVGDARSVLGRTRRDSIRTRELAHRRRRHPPCQGTAGVG